MIYRISKAEPYIKGTIYLTSSKSESNRVLVIQALCKQKFRMTNLADAQDTQLLAAILKSETSGDQYKSLNKLGVEVTYYTGPGGTTIRFLTAFFATREGTRILVGSERMNQRPIKALVDALNSLGADISYLGTTGCPPIKIVGKKLKGGDLTLDASISSQFITALLLIAPTFENGLNLYLKGHIVSRSYIMMTLKILEHFGIKYKWKGNTISIAHQEYQGWDYHIEADWSAASYWYEMTALAQEVDLTIKGLRRESLQGDAVTADLFSFFGITTTFIEDGIHLMKNNYRPTSLAFDFSDSPDVAQTATVVAASLRIDVQFNGLETLRGKETDRITALKKELEKLGITVESDEESLRIDFRENKDQSVNLTQRPTFATYDDHRMAMAFTPLALIYPEVKIQEPHVVKKSYPDFWNDLKTIGFTIREE